MDKPWISRAPGLSTAYLWLTVGAISHGQAGHKPLHKPAISRLHKPLVSQLRSRSDKGGDRTQAAQYRPITLLNTDYRLLAAVLGSRLGPHLPDVIDPVQTAFLRGRSIGKNIWFLQMLPHALAADGRSGVVAICNAKRVLRTGT